MVNVNNSINESHGVAPGKPNHILCEVRKRIIPRRGKVYFKLFEK